MSDAVIISIVSGFFTLATLIVTAIINKKVNVVKTEVTDVKSNVVEQAKKVDEVKAVVTEQVQKAEKIVVAVDDYHKEVNGKMGLLLEKTEALAKAEQKIENHKT